MIFSKLSIYCGALTLLSVLPVCAQVKAMKPGVTVWLYETGEEMRELPILVDGQTPNVSDDFAAIDFSGQWHTTYESPLLNYYVGHAWGALKIETGGT
ncbi:MAG: hypothetical protein JWO82_224 [Akkermansiaceae bacterium]|nr:hypothetical protein [Akkermansiaceae bacterium]